MDISRSRSFGAAAEHYDRVRPRYPAEAVRWALAAVPGAGPVVDLGAGTGILSGLLRDLGYTVIPVEPDPLMRARLRESTGLTALDGAAEGIPLPDEAAAAVVAGQAYHWFDRERAHAEIARVLRPGGVFAPIWNVRDESVPWVAELGRLLDETADEEEIGDFGPLFTPAEQRTFAFTMRQTEDSLVDLITSRSQYLVAGAEERRRIERVTRTLARERPDPEFDLPYLTETFRSVKA